ncbi:MAG: lipoprotein transporter ATP-binding protein [Gammaproteobacteria bacterium]|jgi:lipoprotein-releasing system ATP-binding protein|nr:lipoprotein transporter ATP-binding protein [Gammaproteobacteria bacterium]
MSSILRCEKLSKTYIEGKMRTPVLHELSFSIQAKERVAIVGSSGSGKSTLLHILGGLDQPSSGEVWVNDQPLSKMSDNELSSMRNHYLGFIYQFHHLLAEFTALENVSMPLLLRKMPVKLAQEQAASVLKAVGLEHRLYHRPSELSGGERQRTAIARALVTQPLCILADEPTGNLDRHNAEEIYRLMLELNQEFSTSLLIVTHDYNLAAKMDRVLSIQDGIIE